MLDLKPYYDSAQAADDEVKRIMHDMNEHFALGTEEGKQAAMDLRPALDTAKEKAAAANQLYISMRDAAATSNSVAKEFVPAGTTSNTADAVKGMTLEAFDALDDTAKMKFMRGGGSILPESD